MQTQNEVKLRRSDEVDVMPRSSPAVHNDIVPSSGIMHGTTLYRGDIYNNCQITGQVRNHINGPVYDSNFSSQDVSSGRGTHDNSLSQALRNSDLVRYLIDTALAYLGNRYISANVVDDALDQHIEDSFLWFLNSAQFQGLLDNETPMSNRPRASVMWAVGPRKSSNIVTAHSKPALIASAPYLAGVGKTCLSAALLKHLRRLAVWDPTVVVVYAFLQTWKPAPAKAIIAGLLGQILDFIHLDFEGFTSNDNRQPKAVLKALSLVLARRRESPGDSLSRVELFDLFREVVGLFNRVYVILDGLDEAKDAVRETLLATLAPHPSINLIITSRPLGDLLLKHHTPNALTVDIRSLNGEGIKTWLNHRIDESSTLWALRSGTHSMGSVVQAPHVSLTEQQVEKIKTLSEGR